MFALVVARTPDCGVGHLSEADTQLRAYEPTVQQSFHSALAIFVWSLEDFRRNDVLADPK